MNRVILARLERTIAIVRLRQTTIAVLVLLGTRLYCGTCYACQQFRFGTKLIAERSEANKCAEWHLALRVYIIMYIYICVSVTFWAPGARERVANS